MNKKHGGPAFPFNYHNQTRDYQECFATDNMIAPDGAAQYKGLSVRDYFAAKAMQGLLAAPYQASSDQHMLARDAYTVADAMLEAGGYDE